MPVVMSNVAKKIALGVVVPSLESIGQTACTKHALHFDRRIVNSYFILDRFAKHLRYSPGYRRGLTFAMFGSGDSGAMPLEESLREPSMGAALPAPAVTAVFSGLLRRYRAPLMGVADALIIGGACFTAYLLRFHSPAVAQVLPFKMAIPDPIVYAVISLIMTLSWTFLMWHEGLYRTSLCSMRSLGDELRVVFWAGMRALALVMVSSFLFQVLVISRIFLLMGFALALGLVLLLRLLLGQVLKRLASRDVLLERFVLLGTGSTSLQILQRLGSLGPLSKVTGLIRVAPNESGGAERLGDLPIFGDTDDIDAIMEERRITGVIFASNGHDYDTDPVVREALIRTVNCCETRGMPFYMIPDALNVAVRRNEVGCCCGFPVIELRDASVHPLYGAAKRLIDVAAAATGLVVGLPVWVAIAAFIKMTSPGPVVFVQERVNREGRVFRMLKFRTMVQDAAARLEHMVDFDALPSRSSKSGTILESPPWAGSFEGPVWTRCRNCSTF